MTTPTPSPVVPIPDSAQLEKRTAGIVAEAEAVAVIDADTYKSAAAFVSSTAEIATLIKSEFRDPKAHAYDLHKWICGMERRFLGPAEEAMKIGKQKLIAYDDEQERRAAEEQRVKEAEARKREEERRLAEALALEEEGDQEAAEDVLAEQVDLPPVVVEKAVPKVGTVQYRMTWQAKVIDVGKLLRFVVANPQFLHLLKPDDVAIRALARSTKGAVKIDGVRMWKEKGIASTQR